MLHTSILLALTCILIAACRLEVADKDGSVSATEVKALPSNAEVLEKAYDDSYQVPAGFYIDKRAGTTRSYSLYHLKDPSVSYELCTDDYDEALTWEAADNATRAVNGDYVTSIENKRYFEFVRELSYPDGIGNVQDPTSPGFARVFKCSYINRDGVDRNLREGFAGRLNIRPLTKEAIRTYAEYMWQFTFFWPAKKKVLDSYSAQTVNAYRHTLLLAFVTGQTDDQCDLIEVVEWVFAVDKNSGQITKSFTPIYQMEARLIEGSPQVCTA